MERTKKRNITLSFIFSSFILNLLITFFLPAVGARHPGDGGLSSEGASAAFWSSTEADNTRGYNLTFSFSASNPSNYVGSSKAYGLSIRCVR